MKKTPLLILFLALLAAPTLAQKVFVDFDETVDFEQFKTFGFKESPEDLLRVLWFVLP